MSKALSIAFLGPREKLLRVSSQDYGRDLQGVQNLLKKHKRLEGELVAHEPTIQVGRVEVCGSVG